MKPVIFLDVDGPLVTTGYKQELKDKGVRKIGPEIPDGGKRSDRIDPRAIGLLNSFASEVDAQIVISSSWRTKGVTLGRLATAIGLDPRRVVGRTPYLPDGDRGDEINQYIEEHGVDNWVTFDDSWPPESVKSDPRWRSGSRKTRWVRVTQERGITTRRLRAARAALGVE